MTNYQIWAHRFGETSDREMACPDEAGTEKCAWIGK